MSGWPGWQYDVLAALGAPASQSNLALLGAWQGCEGGSATWNPLNTTQPAPGATDYNSVHVRNYPDKATGIRATAQTLTNGYYAGIVRDLRAGSLAPADVLARNASEFDTWGTGTACISRIVGSSTAPPPVTAPRSPIPLVSTPTVTHRAEASRVDAPIDFSSLTRSWHRLVLTFGQTMPTQGQRVRHARRAMALTLYRKTPRG